MQLTLTPDRRDTPKPRQALLPLPPPLSIAGLLPGAEPADLRPTRAYEFLQQAAAAQQAAPAEECLREHHSLVYVHALQNTMQPVCWPANDSSSTHDTVASTLLCSYRAIGAAEAHCVGTNLALDLHSLQVSG